MESAGVEWKVYCGEQSEEWTLERRVEWRLEWKERLSRPLGKLLEASCPICQVATTPGNQSVRIFRGFKRFERPPWKGFT